MRVVVGEQPASDRLRREQAVRERAHERPAGAYDASDFAEHLHRAGEVVHRHAARRGVERGVREREHGIGVEVVHDPGRGLRVGGELLRVEPEDGQLRGRRHEVRHPRAHEIEDGAVQLQLLVERADRGDRVVVDVRDERAGSRRTARRRFRPGDRRSRGADQSRCLWLFDELDDFAVRTAEAHEAQLGQARTHRHRDDRRERRDVQRLELGTRRIEVADEQGRAPDAERVGRTERRGPVVAARGSRRGSRLTSPPPGADSMISSMPIAPSIRRCGRVRGVGGEARRAPRSRARGRTRASTRGPRNTPRGTTPAFPDLRCTRSRCRPGRWP